MEEFFKDLGGQVQQAIKKDVTKILKQIGEEKIYAVALVTDSDCVSLYLALNTYEYMKKRDEEYVKMFQDKWPEQQIRGIKEGTVNLTKWIPADWGYSDEKESELTQISNLLFAKEESDSEEFARHKDLFFETLTSAFKEVIDSKVFGDDSEGITYFISMSDDGGIYEIEDYSAKLLNTEEVCEAFLKRHG